MEQKSLGFLDWPELLERLAAEVRSTRGAAACRALELASTPHAAAARIAALDEMAAVLLAEGHLPGLGFPEVETHLAAVEKGQPLGAAELREVAELCEVSAGARHFFEVRSQPSGGGAPAAPRLWSIAQDLAAPAEIARQARETFDAAGEIRAEVSPELGQLRRERDGLSVRVRTEIESLMRSDEFAPYLQDEFVTQRADRFVLPLRASFKSMGLGIVHDTSRTGETVFIEPTRVVELNNRLKVAELDIRRESRRILEALAAEIAAAAPALRADMEILCTLDVIAAKARLSAAYDGAPVEVVDAPIVDLRAARHPLLVLRAAKERFAVVANDVALGEVPGSTGARVLVVSGPNAGGKTVLLKTVGLAALMARAGLHVPAAAGSRVGFFDPILADIGDQQSVMGDLSTFSAHLANLGGILDAGARPDARPLVLVDEIAAGTNPDQGGALARAVLEATAELAGLVLVTTHYDGLKALAESDPRFRNAGMEYDLERLRPTFRLKDGTPGRSYALDIAARMGLPEPVLARARELAGASTVGLEQVIATLEAREAELGQKAAALEEARRDLSKLSGDQKAAAEALARREKDLARHSREAIEAAVGEARRAIHEIVAQARRSRSVEEARRAGKALELTARKATEGLPAQPSLDVEKLKSALATRALGVTAGTTPRPSAAARPPANGRKSDSESFAPKAPTGDREHAGRAAAHSAAPRSLTETDTIPGIQSAANTVDLRGLRADEALDAVVAFLDRAAMTGTSPLFVVHGHGTGALRKAVREYLVSSPYVKRWRPGGRGQGGDGVSVVEI